jgi:hypothetical protein
LPGHSFSSRQAESKREKESCPPYRTNCLSRTSRRYGRYEERESEREGERDKYSNYLHRVRVTSTFRARMVIAY